MKPDQALLLMGTLCDAFQAATGRAAAFAIAAEGYDFEPMRRAVVVAINTYDRCPSFKALTGLYYAERRAMSENATNAGRVPCGPCQREGGYLTKPGGERHPPTAATAPFIRGWKMAVEVGEKTADVVAWDADSCCEHHAPHAAWEHRAVQGPIDPKYGLRGRAWLDANPPPKTMHPAWVEAVEGQVAAQVAAEVFA